MVHPRTGLLRVRVGVCCAGESNESGCVLGCECGLMLTLRNRVQKGRYWKKHDFLRILSKVSQAVKNKTYA